MTFGTKSIWSDPKVNILLLYIYVCVNWCRSGIIGSQMFQGSGLEPGPYVTYTRTLPEQPDSKSYFNKKKKIEITALKLIHLNKHIKHKKMIF